MFVYSRLRWRGVGSLADWGLFEGWAARVVVVDLGVPAGSLREREVEREGEGEGGGEGDADRREGWRNAAKGGSR